MAETQKIEWNTTAEEITKIYKTDLTGKVAIVTGSNSGIGLETARVLALVHAKVIIPCRTLEKANGAIEHIKKTVPDADLVPMQLDLSDLASVKAFADNFLQLNLPLDILVNNAGVVGLPKLATKDGFEMIFGVNHLGHFYLTSLLTEKLKSSAPARVVVVSSAGNLNFCGKEGLDFSNLMGEKSYGPASAYGRSKLANIFHAKELQRRFDQEGIDITVTSVHPGAVYSNLGHDAAAVQTLVDTFRVTREWMKLLKEFSRYKKTDVGASTSIYCAVSPDVVKGEYYCDNAVNTILLNEQANNEEMAKQLWEVSEKLVFKK